MPARFTVLASGSSGNTSLLQVGEFGLLIDCGLPPRVIGGRLAMIGSSWERVHAVILTHTHGDHWKDWTLAHLRSRRIPLYAHSAQLDHLNTAAASFAPLHSASLTRQYTSKPFSLTPGLECQPIPVSHDADPTFAFRFGSSPTISSGGGLGFATDLGCASQELLGTFAGVQALAVEYNHDKELERSSSRPRFLVQRVLSDTGHLSNCQAAAVTRTVASSSTGFRHLVQLHLSRDCNRPDLAATAGKASLTGVAPSAEVITAGPDLPTKTVLLWDVPNRVSRPAAISMPITAPAQPCLPGFELG